MSLKINYAFGITGGDFIFSCWKACNTYMKKY